MRSTPKSFRESEARPKLELVLAYAREHHNRAGMEARLLRDVRERLVEVDDFARSDAVAPRDADDVIVVLRDVEAELWVRKLVELDAVDGDFDSRVRCAQAPLRRADALHDLYARKSSGFGHRHNVAINCKERHADKNKAVWCDDALTI